jgi:hypothetical protein
MAFTSEGCEMTPSFSEQASYLNACGLKIVSIPSQKEIKS